VTVTATPTVTPRVRRAAARLGWALLCAPGAYQLALLAIAVARRYAYPYDLEWMEGGMLVHAQRLLDGHGIYVAPSVDFIPYLYTPLYPALLAGLARLPGLALSYQLGRAVSVLSIAAILALGAWAVWREARPRWRAAGAVGAAVCAGFFAATYPWVEGWYDLVRGDTLFLALATGGLVVLRAAAVRPAAGGRGFLHPGAAVAGALLALSFFAKQTGVLLVAAGAVALAVMRWRALASYLVSAGVVGGGGSWLLDRATSGWYWIYVYRVHQQHDTNLDRFWRSFANIWSQFPVLTAALLVMLVAVAAHASALRRLPRGGGAFLYWMWLHLAGTAVGALGWATQWAHFNAYIPALTFGAIAAGAGVVALAGCFEELPARWRVPQVAVTLVAAALGWQLYHARWQPRRLVPTALDRAAGDRLIADLRGIPGEVLIPSHPWYAHLAGKPTFTHRMGLLDVGYQPPPSARKPPLPPAAHQVAGLSDALHERRFGAVVIDDHWAPWELPGLDEGYRVDHLLRRDESPRVVTGAVTAPATVWTPVPPVAPPPPGARVLFDFETGDWEGWQVSGTAWGPGPASAIPGFRVLGAGGRRFACSYCNGRHQPTGTLVSPTFDIRGRKLRLRVGGGDNPATARVELRPAAPLPAVALRKATGNRGTTLGVVEWDVGELRGQRVQLALIDAGSSGWDYLLVDDVWELP
jgi:hypothetical protein